MARILIFDDDPNGCASLARSLRNQGHWVSVAREHPTARPPMPHAGPGAARARRARWWAYTLALTAPAAVLVGRLDLGFASGTAPTMIFFVLPVLLSAYLGGLGPGLLSTAAVAFGVDFFLLTPQYSLAISSGLLVVQWLGLIAIGVLVSVLNEALHRARWRAEAGNRLNAVTLASIGDAVITTDHASRVTFLNPEAERLTGWAATAAAGQPLSTVFRIVNAETHMASEDPAAQVLRSGTTVGLANHTLLARDGRELPIDSSGAPIKDAGGALLGVVLVFRDRTEAVQTEAALRTSEQRFRSLAENSPDIIYIIDLGLSQATYLNQPTLLGYTLAELQAPGSITHAVHPEDVAALARHWQALTQGADVGPIEYRLRRKDGEWEWVQSREKVLARMPDGCPSQLLLTLSVVTERKHIHATLETERYWLRMLIDHLPDLIFLKDRHSHFVIANQTTATFMGADAPAALIGKSDFDFYPHDLALQYYAQEQQIMAEGQPLVGWEKVQLDLAGNEHWLATTKLPLRDQQGQVIGLIGIERDITARKHAEQQVKAHAARLQLLADATRAFAEAGAEYQAVLDRVVCTTAELLSDACSIRLLSDDGEWLQIAALHDTDPTAHEQMRLTWGATAIRVDELPFSREAFRSGQPVLSAQLDYAQLRADWPPEHWSLQEQLSVHSMIVAPLRMQAQVIGLLYLARHRHDLPAYTADDLWLAQDLADRAALAISNARLFQQARSELARRQEAEQALRESEQQYRTVLEAIADGMFVAQDHRFVFVNRVLPAMLGYTYDEFVGRRFEDVVAPEFLQLWTERFDQRVGNGAEPANHYEVRFLRRAGEPVWVELRANRMQYRNRPGVFGLIRDITERKQAEEQIKKLNEDLERRVAERTADLAHANAVLQAEIAERTQLAEQIRQHAQRVSAQAEFARVLAEVGVELQPLFDTLTRYVGRLMGDTATVALLSEDRQQIETKAVYHATPELLALLHELFTSTPYPVTEGMAGQVIRTGQALLLANLTPTQARWQLRSSFQAYLDTCNIASMLIVPLRARGRILGTLGVSRDQPGRPYSADDQAFLQDLADRAGLAIENARLFHAAQIARTDADRANRAKSEFLASMSHELRTPLNAILGFTGTLLMRLPGPLNPDQERQLTTVKTSAQHLLALINDILDLAKIEAGKVELAREPVVCQALLSEVAASLQPLAVQKGLGFMLSMPDAPLTLASDRRALSQILINLINNAIKFTDQGEVRIDLAHRAPAADAGALIVGEQSPALSRAEGSVIVRVHDTGIGIRAEDQARLFQAFERVPPSGGRWREGTGLGLRLSHKLAALLGGEIRLVSEYGVGSTFMLILPEQ